MFLSLLDQFEKENSKSAEAGVVAHDARFEFALWLERNAAQHSVQRTASKRSPKCTCDTNPHAPWCVDSKARRR